MLAELARREVNELQVEAGPILSGALLAAGLADELLLYLAPMLLGDTAQPMARLPALAGARRLPRRWRWLNNRPAALISACDF